MNTKKTLLEIKKDLRPLQKYEVVLFGSYATRYFTERSDIDVAIITREKTPKKNQKILFDLFASQKPPYEFHLFELLPLHIKMEIITKHKVIWGEEKRIAEYFYHFRKLWKDQEARYKENLIYSISKRAEMLCEK